jgi:hypothetical protein
LLKSDAFDAKKDLKIRFERALAALDQRTTNISRD